MLPMRLLQSFNYFNKSSGACVWGRRVCVCMYVCVCVLYTVYSLRKITLRDLDADALVCCLLMNYTDDVLKYVFLCASHGFICTDLSP